MLSFPRHFRFLLLVPLFVAIAAVGCGGGKGTVTGTVKYQNAPMPGGFVFLHHAGSEAVSQTQINPNDGSYTITNVPVGLNKISVKPAPPDGQRPGGPPGMMGGGGMPKDKSQPPPGAGGGASGPPPGYARGSQGKAVKLEDKYTDPEKSGLSVTVKSGKNPHDIDVK